MGESYDRLAAMIVKAREAKGWTQSDLAGLAYVTDAVIARVEAGRPPNMVALRAVEQALGWLPGMFDLVLGPEAEALSEMTAAGGAEEEDEDESGQLRELTADATIDWA
jgi:transcriptional regulator with XRE-family HTH domain